MSVALLNEPIVASLGLTEAQLAVVRDSEDAFFFDGDTIDRCANTDAASLLVLIMSNVSEECYCAGWLTGLGAELRKMVATHGREGAAVPYGMGAVSAAERDTMAALAAMAGGWPEHDTDAGSPFIMLPLQATP